MYRSLDALPLPEDLNTSGVLRFFGKRKSKSFKYVLSLLTVKRNLEVVWKRETETLKKMESKNTRTPPVGDL